MTLSGIIDMRKVLGDRPLGDLPELVCSLCCTWTPTEFLFDVTDFAPLLGKCCAECTFNIQEAAHVDTRDACVCSACAREVAKADAWGRRVL